jgi:hypothetical protein
MAPHPRGRPRKRDSRIPAHIDQQSLPRGVYWNPTGNGRWYVLDWTDGKRTSKVIASRDAKLSDLQRIIEERDGVQRQTLRAVCVAFHGSPEYRALAKATRESYAYSQSRVLDFAIKQGTFGDLNPFRITRPIVQLLIDKLAAGRTRAADGRLVPTPSTAAHALRYLRVVFRWGANRGLCAETNPAQGVEPPKERKRRRLPLHETFGAVVGFARTHGDGVRGKQGSVAPYLWCAAEIAYLCRLRGIEVVCDLTDANVTDAGLLCVRRKGSLPNVTRWDDRLRAAYSALVERRNAIWAKKKRPVPMRPEDRPLVVGTTGEPLSKSAFNSAWQRMIRTAIAEKVISSADRFSMHDLKRLGVTDTAGTRGEKQQASGHRSEAMLDVYDQDVPLVDSAATSRAKKPRS